MPIILVILLIVLIAQFGFWDTLAAIIGAAAMVGLFAVIAIAAVVIAGYLILRRR